MSQSTSAIPIFTPISRNTTRPSARVYLQGHVRIYRGVTLYMGEKATYNLDTKAINADEMRSGTYPYLLSGKTVTSDSDEEYTIKNGSFTTDDSSQPDFHLNAQSVRIYQNDRVILKNVTFYIGKMPIFWWPYLYQSLDRSFSYSIAPAYLSSWGPSLLGQITFPIGEKIVGTLKLDYRTRRGIALGFDSEIHYGKENNSVAKITSYYLQDQNPDLNRTSLPRNGTPTSRYRFSIQDRTHITDDSGGDRRNDQTERYLFAAGLFPGGIPGQSATGQRRGRHANKSVLHLDGLQPFSA